MRGRKRGGRKLLRGVVASSWLGLQRIHPTMHIMQQTKLATAALPLALLPSIFIATIFKETLLGIKRAT
jgi:hypothetical protein